MQPLFRRDACQGYRAQPGALPYVRNNFGAAELASRALQRDAYYRRLGEGMEGFFATSGVGWHYKSGIQAVRLVLSGAFERLPDLRLILGHCGEVVLFYLERLDMLTPMAKLPRPVSNYFTSNMWVTPSGLLSHRYMRWAIEVMGVERIMFATDYPFLMAKGGRARRRAAGPGRRAPRATSFGSRHRRSSRGHRVVPGKDLLSGRFRDQRAARS